MLALDPSDVNVETAAHEMGHAIFSALKSQAESKGKDAAKAGNLRLIVADIYARLSQTKEFTEDKDRRTRQAFGLPILRSGLLAARKNIHGRIQTSFS